MTIYVDNLIACNASQSKRWAYKKACHLFADSEDELHIFAAKLGLRREWYQDHHPNSAFHHYDITENKRREAIKLGAVAITWRQRAEMIQRIIQGGKQ